MIIRQLPNLPTFFHKHSPRIPKIRNINLFLANHSHNSTGPTPFPLFPRNLNKPLFRYLKRLPYCLFNPQLTHSLDNLHYWPYLHSRLGYYWCIRRNPPRHARRTPRSNACYFRYSRGWKYGPRCTGGTCRGGCWLSSTLLGCRGGWRSLTAGLVGRCYYYNRQSWIFIWGLLHWGQSRDAYLVGGQLAKVLVWGFLRSGAWCQPRLS